MNDPEDVIRETPWDSVVFGIKTFEVSALSEDIMERVLRLPGHYTVRVDPLSNKEILHRYGFYYCDTLIEPFCLREQFVFHDHEAVRVSKEVSLDKVLAICHGAFACGRFHRDFNIRREFADQRYDNWLKQLYREGNVYGLMFGDELAGFIGLSGNMLALHAVAEQFRGQGLARHLWSVACREFFRQGRGELTSSISAANVTAVNLYASLGFRFRKPRDVYHRLTV